MVVSADDFGVEPGVSDLRLDIYEIQEWESSYGTGPVKNDLADLDMREDATRDRILDHRRWINERGDLLFALVVCKTHRKFINGRHRLSAAIWVGMSSVPVVDQCYCASDNSTQAGDESC